MTNVDHIAGTTFHGRKGGPDNAFRYRVDYILLDPESEVRAPWPFRRNARGLVSLHDSDHGGAPGEGRGAQWLRAVLGAHGLAEVIDGPALLLAQPRVLGHVFNPVSFWLVYDRKGGLRVVVAEVTNTFGDRHSYLCHRDDLKPIGPTDRLTASKVMHVSPFQPVTGHYVFRFDIRRDRIGIWIDYEAGNGEGGVLATLTGHRKVLTTGGLITAILRRPFGSRRVLGLIHWQALRLWLRGAPYRSRPSAPGVDVSR